MKWLDKLIERRVSSRDPSWANMFGIPTGTGQHVSEESAGLVPTVHAAVQTIAESIASMPLAPMVKQSDGSKVVDYDHPLYSLLHDQANESQSSFEFREAFIASCLLTGNAFALIDRDESGRITGLIPVHPSMVSVEKLTSGRLRYKVSTEQGSRVYLQSEMVHLKYRSRDGVLGMSPISAGREIIATALSQQEFDANFYAHGAAPGAVFQHPGKLTQEQVGNIRNSIEKNFSGSAKAHRVLVLEENMEFRPLSLSHVDSEFIASRKLAQEDIARLFRIPPPALGLLDRATFSNVVELNRQLVTHTLRPWCVRLEQVLNMALLSEDGRRTHTISHNMNGLLRGDLKSRFESYRIGREAGIYSANDCRALEDMPSIPNGDTYMQPMNMEDLSKAAD